MENDEQTNEATPTGEKTNSNPEENKETVSLYDKTEAIVTRQEEANKKTEELLARQETLHANERLAGTGGAGIPRKTAEETQEERVQEEANKITDRF